MLVPILFFAAVIASVLVGLAIQSVIAWTLARIRRSDFKTESDAIEGGRLGGLWVLLGGAVLLVVIATVSIHNEGNDHTTWWGVSTLDGQVRRTLTYDSKRELLDAGCVFFGHNFEVFSSSGDELPSSCP